MAQDQDKSGRHQRRLKNYLLDARFQMKYTSYLVGIAMVLSVSLGIILWRTSEAVIVQSESTVAQGSRLVEESKKVSAVVEANISEQYADNPALLEVFKDEAKTRDGSLETQQADLEVQAQNLKKQRRNISIALIGVLTLLVVCIGIAGILVTHKIAGPIYKMKRHLKEVTDGSYQVPRGLRKGDELVDFFEQFREMVMQLRERQEREIALLDGAIGRLEGKVDEADLEPVRAVRKEMKDALDV